MLNDSITREEQYYNNFYNTGEYQIRKIHELSEEKKFLDECLKKYNAKRQKRCLEVGSGGGVTGYSRKLYRAGSCRIC